MNNKRWLTRWISGLYCAAALVATVTGQMARGQEEVPPPPPGHRVGHFIVFDDREMRAIERAGESLLGELGPGFTVTVTRTPVCVASSCNTGAAQTCNELGAFNPQAGCFVKQACPCIAGGDCHCVDVCHCGSDCVCGAECLASRTEQVCQGQCPGEACDVALAHAEEAPAHHEEHLHHRVRIHHDQPDLIHHLVDLVADRAAARTELECRREASAKMADLYETVAELIAANAALEAKLEAQIEHTKTLHKVAELAAENARLKTHVELAGSRTDSSQQMISLTLENERLKLRLADLEHKHAASEASQTAERMVRDRKSR
jgi:hypothetical protein